jgi:Fur family ferric uptake transcriptional regulator
MVSEPSEIKPLRTKATPAEQFAQYLARRGKRMTPQRELIVEQIFSHHDHFDVEELLNHLQALINQRRVSRPTVYRTLAELVAAGLLRKITIGPRAVYEHEYGYPSHDHFFCQSCGALIEFHAPALEELRDRLAQDHGFEVTGHRMFILGLCRDCKVQDRNSVKPRLESPGLPG